MSSGRACLGPIRKVGFCPTVPCVFTTDTGGTAIPATYGLKDPPKGQEVCHRCKRFLALELNKKWAMISRDLTEISQDLPQDHGMSG